MEDLFVFILDEDYAHKSDKIAGRLPMDWLTEGLNDIPFSVVREVNGPLPSARYIAAVPASCPLVQKEYLLSLIKEMDKRSIASADLGRGKIARRDGFFLSDPKVRLDSPYLLDLTCPGLREKAESELLLRVAEGLMASGVRISDPALVRITADCAVEKGAVIEPFVRIENSVVRSGAVIGSFSSVLSSEIGEGAEIVQSRIEASVIGKGAKIGPFAFIRMGSAIGDGCRIGDFVEIKASRVADGAKAAHLAYIGDADVGMRTNVGCGTVFANYDGKTKHRTSVGSDAFIGANVNLVAPLTVGDGAFIAAGTTVTEDVSEGAFVIGRVRAEEKKGK